LYSLLEGRSAEWARAHFFVGRDSFYRRERTGFSNCQNMELERIRDAAERVASTERVEVWDVEWKIGKDRILRVYIDKPEGVSHADCQAVSEQLSVILDVEDLVPGQRYTLEISSPGMDRKLFKPEHFQRFIGRMAKIWLHQPVEPGEGAKPLSYVEGRLTGFTDGRVSIELAKTSGKGIIEVQFENIRKANLIVEF
jgi:ribosome maturation factor RimP